MVKIRGHQDPKRGWLTRLASTLPPPHKRPYKRLGLQRLGMAARRLIPKSTPSRLVILLDQVGVDCCVTLRIGALASLACDSVALRLRMKDL